MNVNVKKRKRVEQNGPSVEETKKIKYQNNVEGSFNTGQVEANAERQLEQINKKLKKQAKEEFDLGTVMPLNYNLEQGYMQTVEAGAEKDDKRFYRDGVFHSDEQEEKTRELKEQDDKYKLLGLDEPDDPGYFPPILYEHHSPVKNPVITMTSEKTGMEFYTFPLTWDQIGTDWTIVVIGKRRSGKTCWVKSLCGYRLRPYFPRVVVFTKTKCSGEYSKFIPDAHIHAGYDEEKLNKYFAMQKEYKTLEKDGSFHGNNKLLIILDDCLSDQLKYKKTIDEVFFEGRHLNICFIISTQDIKGIAPSCFSNADLGVCFNLRSERDKEAMRTKFCDFFKNDEEMTQLTNAVTHRKWHVICFDQHQPHRDPRFTVYCGRAPPPPPFVMGCAAWWKKNRKQLEAIVNDEPELEWILHTSDWGLLGEQEFNQVL